MGGGLRAALAVLAALGVQRSAAVAAPGPAPVPRGTYRMSGQARVVARPVLSRSVDVHADAVLRAGPSPRSVLVRVSAEGAACEIEATVDAAGALAFRPDQPCTANVRSADTRAHVDARLRMGSGRATGDELALDLSWELSGRVSFRTAQRVELGGKTVELPAMWTPEVPVHGEAQGTATGRLDASRAAEPVR